MNHRINRIRRGEGIFGDATYTGDVLWESEEGPIDPNVKTINESMPRQSPRKRKADKHNESIENLSKKANNREEPSEETSHETIVLNDDNEMEMSEEPIQSKKPVMQAGGKKERKQTGKNAVGKNTRKSVSRGSVSGMEDLQSNPEQSSLQ